MGRKRKPSDQSSDDDFAPSASDDESLVFSRLKRPKRGQSEGSSQGSRSNRKKSVKEIDDEGQDLESLLESLQGNDSRQPCSPKSSVFNNKEDSRESMGSKLEVIDLDHGFSKESAALSKASSQPDSLVNRSIEINPVINESSKIISASDEIAPSDADLSLPSRHDVQQEPPKQNLSSFDIRDDSPERTHNFYLKPSLLPMYRNLLYRTDILLLISMSLRTSMFFSNLLGTPIRSRRTKSQKRPRYVSSDSENEPSGDDDDAYHSQSDSPDEAGSDSEFELLQQKPARKKAAKVSPRPAATSKKQSKTVTKSEPSVRVKKPIAKTGAVKKKSIPRTTPSVKPAAEKVQPLSNQKKRLGSRLPVNGLLRSGISNNQKKPTSNGTARVGNNAVFRAGLSRRAQTPRLHSYLSNK